MLQKLGKLGRDAPGSLGRVRDMHFKQEKKFLLTLYALE